MLRRAFYIVALLLLSACPSYLYAAGDLQQRPAVPAVKKADNTIKSIFFDTDTNKIKRIPQNRMDILDHSTIKEVPKTKRQPKPEKIVAPADTANNNKPRSKRRPEGLERPPDIIRRNNN